MPISYILQHLLTLIGTIAIAGCPIICHHWSCGCFQLFLFQNQREPYLLHGSNLISISLPLISCLADCFTVSPKIIAGSIFKFFLWLLHLSIALSLWTGTRCCFGILYTLAVVLSLFHDNEIVSLVCHNLSFLTFLAVGAPIMHLINSTVASTVVYSSSRKLKVVWLYSGSCQCKHTFCCHGTKCLFTQYCNEVSVVMAMVV